MGPCDPITHDRLAAAEAHYHSCTLCEHRCGTNRHLHRGKCHAGAIARVFRHRVECGEEDDLNPCHLFYLSGCDLRCVFCINELNAFDASRGHPLTPEFLQNAVAAGRQRNAKTLQWVGGEPTIHLPAILSAAASLPQRPPFVWKSDFHFTPEAFRLMTGLVDVFIADFKFGNDACAKRLAGVSNYMQILTRNLLLARGQARLIVRHLLLPGHFECCWRPIARWMADHLPEIEVSIRGCFLPRYRASHFVELSAPLDREAHPRALAFARSLQLRVIQ
jgi:putative pyruvate formate lyase activating enzyme